MSRYFIGEGRATADAELRHTQQGKAVCNVNVATNERVKDRQTNEWSDDEALFIRVTVFDQQAEVVANAVKKGSPVLIAGKLQRESYTTQQGEVRDSFNMIADNIGIALRWKPKGERQQSAPRRQQSAPQQDAWGEPAEAWDESTPF